MKYELRMIAVCLALLLEGCGGGQMFMQQQQQPGNPYFLVNGRWQQAGGGWSQFNLNDFNSLAIGQQFPLIIGREQKRCTLIDRGVNAVADAAFAGTGGYVVERLLNLNGHKVSALAATGGLLAGATFACDPTMFESIKKALGIGGDEQKNVTTVASSGRKQITPGYCDIKYEDKGATLRKRVVNPENTQEYCDRLKQRINNKTQSWKEL